MIYWLFIPYRFKFQPGQGEEEADMQTPSKWKQEAAGQACLDTHYVLPLPSFCAILSCVVAWLAWCLVSRYLWLPGAMTLWSSSQDYKQHIRNILY